MKLITTIGFKSVSNIFKKEQRGIKNNTVRFVNKDEDKKILSILDDIKYIQIINADNKECIVYFIRAIQDITRYVQNDIIIYIFTWEV